MNWLLAGALFFIVWWVVLFAMLPVGLHTQEEDGEVTLGTTESAPRGPHMLRVIIRTTLLTGVLFAIYYVVVGVYGFGLDDLPYFGPTR